MSLERDAIQATGRTIEAGLNRQVGITPPYRTVSPHLDDQTTAIGALDGSDQQMFALASDPEKGVGVYATLYCELDPRDPAHKDYYRDGPSSAGLWNQQELLSYHIALSLPDAKQNRHVFNDVYTARQILSNTRPSVPPVFNMAMRPEGARREAAKQRATAEWLAVRSAAIQQAPPGALLLRDGRLNSQIEQAAHWVDQTGRIAARNGVRIVSLVKSGALYGTVTPMVRNIAAGTDRPFYFSVPAEFILEAYDNENLPVRKTLMLGGKDHTDLGGIGALWTVFCPDPVNWRSFVIIEFNLYDLHHYRDLAHEPMTLRQWQAHHFLDRFHTIPKGVDHVYVTDLVIDEEHDLGGLVEGTLSEVLWLCEREIARFGYPNLLGIAHHDVVLTTKKMKLLRQRFEEIWAHSDRLLEELVPNEFVETPHKLHNIY